MIEINLKIKSIQVGSVKAELNASFNSIIMASLSIRI